jgi:serine/threonine-protein kinase
MSLAQARRAIRDRGFKVDVAREYSDTVPEGKVIETRPPGRTQLDLGQSVTLVVSRGVEEVPVPDLVGLHVDDARTQLDDAQLVTSVKQQESDKPVGTVLRQSPPPQTLLRKGETVTITVAKEPTTVDVPDVSGAQVNDAVDALTKLGLIPRQKTVAVDTPDQDGVVVEQSPQAGKKVKKGAKVTIRVGRFSPPLPGPEGTAGASPSPTPAATP